MDPLDRIAGATVKLKAKVGRRPGRPRHRQAAASRSRIRSAPAQGPAGPGRPAEPSVSRSASGRASHATRPSCRAPEQLAATLTWLGKAHVQLKDLCRRLQQLSPSASTCSNSSRLSRPSPSQQAGHRRDAHDVRRVRRVRGDTRRGPELVRPRRQEGVTKPPQGRHPHQGHRRDLADLLPFDLRAIYQRFVEGDTPSRNPAFVSSFPAAIKKALPAARLERQASTFWHDLAATHETRKEMKEFRQVDRGIRDPQSAADRRPGFWHPRACQGGRERCDRTTRSIVPRREADARLAHLDSETAPRPWIMASRSCNWPTGTTRARLVKCRSPRRPSSIAFPASRRRGDSPYNKCNYAEAARRVGEGECASAWGDSRTPWSFPRHGLALWQAPAVGTRPSQPTPAASRSDVKGEAGHRESYPQPCSKP